MDNYSYFGGPARRVTGYEAASLLAFALAALLEQAYPVCETTHNHARRRASRAV
jgi:hypothetical protein